MFRSPQGWTLELRILLGVRLQLIHLVLTFHVAKTAKLFDTKFSVNIKIILYYYFHRKIKIYFNIMNAQIACVNLIGLIFSLVFNE